MNIYKLIFMILNYSWYILFGLAYFKLWKPAHNYLEIITFYFKIFIACIIIYFFNPYKKTENCSGFHRSIIFTSGTFLLLSEGLMKIFNNIKDHTKEIVEIIK